MLRASWLEDSVAAGAMQPLIEHEWSKTMQPVLEHEWSKATQSSKKASEVREACEVLAARCLLLG